MVDAKPEEKPARIVDAEPKFTKALAAKFVDIVRKGNFRETACAQVGITSRTLRNWLSQAAKGNRRYTGFVRDLDNAEAEAESAMVVSVRKAGMSDWRAAAWYLERRGAKRWGFKAQVEHSVEEELSRYLDVIEQELGSEAAARIFARLTDGAVSEGAPRGVREAEGSEGSGQPVH